MNNNITAATAYEQAENAFEESAAKEYVIELIDKWSRRGHFNITLHQDSEIRAEQLIVGNRKLRDAVMTELQKRKFKVTHSIDMSEGHSTLIIDWSKKPSKIKKQ